MSSQGNPGVACLRVSTCLRGNNSDDGVQVRLDFYIHHLFKKCPPEKYPLSLLSPNDMYRQFCILESPSLLSQWLFIFELAQHFAVHQIA